MSARPLSDRGEHAALKRIVERVGELPVVVMDSLSQVGGEDRGAIVVCGSHGSALGGRVAREYDLAAVFFNDAGVGKQRAGIGGLALLDDAGVPAGAVSHLSARIGSGLDTWEDGVLSHVNTAAAARGLRAGDRLREAVRDAFA